MIFRQLFDQESSTYTYLLGDEESRQAVLIDTVKENVDEYCQLMKDLNVHLLYILDTHVHADHITGAGVLRERTGAKTILHENTKAGCVDLRMKDGDMINFGKYSIKVLHTPGHTPCSASFFLGDRVFTGDALFINGCGRTDFQGGSSSALWNSVVHKLFTLPPDTLVYPAHDYKHMHVSSISQEKELNPRFKGKSEAEFIELMKNLHLPEPKKIHEAVPANEQCGLA